jgi:hypothetical protein
MMALATKPALRRSTSVSTQIGALCTEIHRAPVIPLKRGRRQAGGDIPHRHRPQPASDRQQDPSDSSTLKNDNLPDGEQQDAVGAVRIVRRERLGGLLSFCHRKTAVRERIE